jgi:predicted amidohydrolase
MDNFTLALWQCPYAGHASQALVLLDATAAQARAQGADLLVCPEMSLTGYQIGTTGVAAVAEPADGPLARAVAADGQRLANYRKTHLFGGIDRAQFSPGAQAPAVFEWNGWKLGLLICYDIEFPEPARGLALQGADAILVPTANMIAFDEVQRVLLPARALENRVFLAYANACGQEGETTYGGQSTVCGPMGAVLAQGGRDEELLFASLSRGDLLTARKSSQLNDRRPDLYGPLSR